MKSVGRGQAPMTASTPGARSEQKGAERVLAMPWPGPPAHITAWGSWAGEGVDLYGFRRIVYGRQWRCGRVSMLGLMPFIQLAVEANHVIGLRLMKIATGQPDDSRASSHGRRDNRCGRRSRNQLRFFDHRGSADAQSIKLFLKDLKKGRG